VQSRSTFTLMPEPEPGQQGRTHPLWGMPHTGHEGEHCRMVIALLAVLGVDLIVIVVLLGAVLIRRRWVSHQPGAFKGAIRVVDGEVSGLGPKWKRGYGRWVRDVLVWTKAPALFRNELVAVDGLARAVRAAEPGEVKRLGNDPVIVPLAADGGARVEVAALVEDRGRALGPLEAPAPPPEELLREPRRNPQNHDDPGR
jgi:hypothetical protein